MSEVETIIVNREASIESKAIGYWHSHTDCLGQIESVDSVSGITHASFQIRSDTHRKSNASGSIDRNGNILGIEQVINSETSTDEDITVDLITVGS